jgi:threonine dehydratase
VIEGASATAVAGMLSGRVDIAKKRVGVVISGGNVDDSKFIKILEEYAE